MEDLLKKEEQRLTKAKNLGAKYRVNIEEDSKSLFLKEPDKTTYKMWYATYEDDPAGANETVVRTLTIKEVSDMEIFDDYKALASVFQQLGDIMSLKKSTLQSL